MSTRIEINVNRQALVQAAQQAQAANRRQFAEGQARQAAATAGEDALRAERAEQGLQATGEDLRGRRKVAPRVTPKPTANRRPAGGVLAAFWFMDTSDSENLQFTIWTGDTTVSVTTPMFSAPVDLTYQDEVLEDSVVYTPSESVFNDLFQTVGATRESTYEEIRDIYSVAHRLFSLPMGGDRAMVLVKCVYQRALQTINESNTQSRGPLSSPVPSGDDVCSDGAFNYRDSTATASATNTTTIGEVTSEWHAFIVTPTAITPITPPSGITAILNPFTPSDLLTTSRAYQPLLWESATNHRMVRDVFVDNPDPVEDYWVCQHVWDSEDNPYPLGFPRDNIVSTDEAPFLIRDENRALHQMGRATQASLVFPGFWDRGYVCPGVFKIMEDPELEPSTATPALTVFTTYFPGVTPPAFSMAQLIDSGQNVYKPVPPLSFFSYPDDAVVGAKVYGRYPFFITGYFMAQRYVLWDWDQPAYCRAKLSALGFTG